MRKLLFLVLFTLGELVAIAQNRLVVQSKNGELTYFTLSEGMRVCFEKNYIQVYKDFWNSVNFMLEDFDLIYYDDGNGVGVNTVNGESWTVEEKDGEVMLSGLMEGTPVMLYNTAGVLVASSKAVTGKPVSLLLNTLPAGVYIIQTKQHTLKIKKQ